MLAGGECLGHGCAVDQLRANRGSSRGECGLRAAQTRFRLSQPGVCIGCALGVGPSLMRIVVAYLEPFIGIQSKPGQASRELPCQVGNVVVFGLHL